MKLPKVNEIQIVVFGSGFGESILVHIGDHKWVIVDSFKNINMQPIAINHLENLGIDVGVGVEAVIGTHWHMDHYQGLSQIIKQCKSATVALSGMHNNQEFEYLVSLLSKKSGIRSYAFKELKQCFELLIKRSDKAFDFTEGYTIRSWQASEMSHQKRVVISALSPSNYQFERFSQKCKNLFVKSRKNLPNYDPIQELFKNNDRNNFSIVLQITVGEVSILLGADMQECVSEKFGWKHIVNNRNVDFPNPRFYKVTHHGTEYSHYPELWSKFLLENPTSIVTEYNLGSKKLPKLTDIQRIRNLSEKSYLTSGGLNSTRSQINELSKELIQQSTQFHTYSRGSNIGAVSINIDPNCINTDKNQLSGSAMNLGKIKV